MSKEQWVRPITAGGEPSPNVTAPTYVFGPVNTKVQRGMWVCVDGVLGVDTATVELWVRFGPNGPWYLATSTTFNASEMVCDWSPGLPGDGMEFAPIIRAIAGAPTAVRGGLIGPVGE